MRTARAWLRRLGGTFAGARRDHELTAELDAHLLLHIEDNLRAGMPPDEARRRALIALGGVDQIREAYRDQRGLPWLETTLNDLQSAIRQVRRSSGFSAAVIFTLALGIGASVAIFSIVDGILLQPLPYRDPGRLAMLQYRYADSGRLNKYVSVPDFVDWSNAGSFEGFAAVDWPSSTTLTGRGSPERVSAARATPNFFEVLGVRPQAGRFFLPADGAGQGVVVISDALWRRRFGADADVLGQSMVLDGQPHILVGILPAGLDLPTPSDVWQPMALEPEDSRRRVNLLIAFGRLAAGVSFDRAQSEMTTIARQLETAYPATNALHGIGVVPLGEAWLGSQRLPLLLLLGAAVLLLLLATANVANLLLVRLVARRQELSMRVALGASSSRVLRQLATENLLLLGAGGLLGGGLAQAGIGTLHRLLPKDLPRLGAVALDARALTFAVAIVAAVGLALALAAARGATHIDPRGLIGQARDPVQRRHSSRGRGLLLSGQVAAATVLLIGAALLGRSFLALHRVDPGFRPDGIQTFRVSLPDEAYATADARVAFFDRLIEELHSLPGVSAVERCRWEGQPERPVCGRRTTAHRRSWRTGRRSPVATFER
jgi:predicted permease